MTEFGRTSVRYRGAQPDRSVAYFSMEIALENAIPTYSGGLGVLAGDTLRAAADLRVPMVAVTLLHRQGYFYQRLDVDGNQREEPVEWPIDDLLDLCPATVEVELEGRPVRVRAWACDVRGVGDHILPVYFLDTNLEENIPEDRCLTDTLYGGDPAYRLKQEAVLGIAGVRILRALGYRHLRCYHMNEGHAALLTLELLREGASPDEVRKQCVFTTHTPVAAGHDQFPVDLVRRVLGDVETGQSGVLNLTHLALRLSRYVNGVARRHGEVSRAMFPGHTIDSITNGVHCGTWASQPIQELLDRTIPGWREDNFVLRQARTIAPEEIWKAHRRAKRGLMEYVNGHRNAGMDMDALTLGFARRFAPYKRADLLLSDPDALQRIATEIGPLQIIYAGKAHPRDENGKALIRKVVQAGRKLRPPVKFAFLENYDMAMARFLVSGVDVWLNNPQPPLEASGTSGMKAALNGVPSLSVRDGWWCEGHFEGVTGWEIPTGGDEAKALISKLRDVASLFYRERDRFVEVMRNSIAVNASYFSTHRMVQEYVTRAYLA